MLHSRFYFYICLLNQFKLSNTRLKNIKAYLLAGKLLHGITLAELLAAVLLLPHLYGLQTETIPGEILRLYGIIFISSLPVFAQLDARSRYQNFKQVRDQFYVYGFDERILKPLIKSRCQRDAALLAARETGNSLQCRKLFRNAGYRWYHLFPDFVFTHPGFVFTSYFWKTTFFCSTYKVKFFKMESVEAIPKKMPYPVVDHG